MLGTLILNQLAPNIFFNNYARAHETQTIEQLQYKKQTLRQQTQQLELELRQLTIRRDQIHQALQVEEKLVTKM